MYVAIDLGGTKTLVAVYDADGTVTKQQKFPTNHDYEAFLQDVKTTLKELVTETPHYACMAAPGKIDHERGVAVAFGNLPWRDVPLVRDISPLLGCPLLLENDVKLAALGEARQPAFAGYKEVLYITISTGISDGLVVGGKLDPSHLNSEGGHMVLEHEGRPQTWESFASGKAIVRRFGKRASDINDPAVWQLIARDIASGLINLIADIQPDVVVIGGGVGSHFAKYGDFLRAELKRFENPLVTIPPIMQAVHPEEAVVYGCFEYIKDHVQTLAKA